MTAELQLTLLGGVHITRDAVPIAELVSAKAQAQHCQTAREYRPRLLREAKADASLDMALALNWLGTDHLSAG